MIIAVSILVVAGSVELAGAFGDSVPTHSPGAQSSEVTTGYSWTVTVPAGAFGQNSTMTIPVDSVVTEISATATANLTACTGGGDISVVAGESRPLAAWSGTGILVSAPSRLAVGLNVLTTTTADIAVEMLCYSSSFMSLPNPPATVTLDFTVTTNTLPPVSGPTQTFN